MNPDERYMAFAIELAKIGMGFTWPNPVVGAVIVKDHRIVGIGYHRRKGEAHAEVLAIKDARGLTHGATMYVTLEPHSFYGLVPPCTDAIIKAGIKRVVIAMLDPNPRVRGDGVRILKEHGVEVTIGVLAEEAFFINRFFVKYHEKKSPYIILKYAITLDGFIADEHGNSMWISNEESRKNVHKIRGEVDAILVGRKTLYKDNSRLTPRDVFPAKMPVRVVCGRKFDDTIKNMDFYKIPGEKWILTTEDAKIPVLDDIKVIRCGKGDVDFNCFMQYMYEKEMLSLLVEGGAETGTFLLKRGYVDEILLFKSSKIFGSGKSMFTEPLKIDKMGFGLYEKEEISGDIMLRYLNNALSG